MIDTMTIANIETASGDFVEQNVIAADVEFMMPEEYAALSDITDRKEYQNRFFFLACEYLESYVKDIASTDEAKIAVWYPAKA